jgi:hypothetical protein
MEQWRTKSGVRASLIRTIRDSRSPERQIRENMVLCLECYAGKVGAHYGVKLGGINTHPFEKKLL